VSKGDGVYPEELRYSKEHEWLRLSDSIGTIGISHYAQEELGDIVYVELPKVGTAIVAGESFGTVESVKAVSEIYSPVSGEVAEINGALESGPDAVNRDPYGAGWLVRIKVAEGGDPEGLMSAVDYRRYLEDEAN
jgi:glycine cleavage system H protein